MRQAINMTRFRPHRSRFPVISGLIILLVTMSVAPVNSAAELQDVEVGVEENLGATISLDQIVYDVDGTPLLLADLITRPTIFLLVYYRCPDICSPLMMGLVDVLEKMDIPLGEGYQIVAVSFDSEETPEIALNSKRTMLSMFHSEFPEEAWKFTTTDARTIEILTGDVGFHFKREGVDFSHPAVLTVLSPKGKIARYLYGITFLPFDVKMALTEASQGRIGPTINRVLLFCFSYDPQGQTYVFNILKVTGTLTMFFAAGFVLFLVLSGRRSRAEEMEEEIKEEMNEEEE